MTEFRAFALAGALLSACAASSAAQAAAETAPQPAAAPSRRSAPPGGPERARARARLDAEAEMEAVMARRAEDRAVAQAAALDPKPAVPADAKRLMAKGKALARDARGPEDYLEAEAAMKEALALAPWWASGYFNEALVEEGAGLWIDAAHHLRNFLTLKPDAPNKARVLEKISALEGLDAKGEMPVGL
jgi:hypothetical protein